MENENPNKRQKINRHLKQIDSWQTVIDGIVFDYIRLNMACEAAIKAGTMNIEGPLHEAIWRSFEGMLKRIDNYDWINWFIFENDCGNNALLARGKKNRKMKPIRTTRQLARIIVENHD